MSDHSHEEEEIQKLVSEAAESSSTNPWGPVNNKLAQHVGGGKSARAIGIQDYTVVDRAIGSPGMLKPLDVHGFVVKDPPDRAAADVGTVVDKLKQQIRIAPYITTAVVFPYTNDFYPSDILSSAPDVGGTLAKLYPNARRDLTIKKEAGDTASTVPKGPWRVLAAELTASASGCVFASLDDPEDEARYLAPGDAIVLVDPDKSRHPIGVGRLHHIRPTHSGTLQLVFDRYAALQEAAATSDTIAHRVEEA